MPDLEESPLSFKVAASLKAELQKLADANRRNLSQYLRVVLEDHVAAEKAKKKGK